MSDLYAPWSLRALVAELAAGQMTPAGAIARAEGRIADTEVDIAAWVEHHAPAPAAAQGPLGGVPLGVKDIIDVEGYPTRCGSALRAHSAPATTHAAIVDEWIAAGAVPVGKTVTTEYAFFEPGPTRNPANPEHTPGGSSSGSAAAVASGQVPLALGSQTAGSVTRPASYCGVASLVMTHNRYPTDGVTGLSRSLDSHGMFAATVSDLAMGWSALTGEPDVGAASSAGPPPRLLVWTADSIGAVTGEMSEALASTVEKLRVAGAEADEFPLEEVVAAITSAHRVRMAYEASRERTFELAHPDKLSKPLASLLSTGAAISDSAYETAGAAIAEGRILVAAALAGYDAILGPGAPGAAPAGLGATGDPVLSRSWQALGLPTIGIPGLRNADGLPLGLQIVGRSGGEADALATACWIERIINDTRRDS